MDILQYCTDFEYQVNHKGSLLLFKINGEAFQAASKPACSVKEMKGIIVWDYEGFVSSTGKSSVDDFVNWIKTKHGKA
jgi:hypothetical protein